MPVNICIVAKAFEKHGRGITFYGHSFIHLPVSLLTLRLCLKPFRLCFPVEAVGVLESMMLSSLGVFWNDSQLHSILSLSASFQTLTQVVFIKKNIYVLDNTKKHIRDVI